MSVLRGFGQGARCAAVVFAVVLSARVPVRAAAPPPPSIADAEYGWSKATGRATITGRLAVRTPDGRTMAKNGADVLLLPYSTRTRLYLARTAQQLAARTVQDGVTTPELDPDLAPYARRMRSAGDGSFRFANVPQGTWVVRGRLSVAFPRIVFVGVPAAVDVNGQALAGTEMRRALVFDYTFAWFDSDPVTVRDDQTRDVALHVVARIDRTDPHR